MTTVVRMHGFGGPEVLQYDDVAVPSPAPHEVCIDVGGIGLNRVETMYRSGYFGEPQLPAKIGYEAAGTLNAVGSEVVGFAVGDRVAVLPGLSMEEYGTYGREILYPADMLVRIPDNQTLVEAAATWMQYLTAYGLVAPGGIQRGDYVVITAASSSVGLAAIQIANAVGAIPIAVTRGPAKVEGLHRHGAAHVVASERQDVVAAITDITDGAGATLLFDAVAGPLLGQLLNVMAPRGRVVLYGALAGAEVPLPLHSVMLNGLMIRGFAANELLADPTLREAAIGFIDQGLADGSLQPVIDRVFPFEAIVDAHRYLESNQQLGKIVVAIES